MEQRPLRLGDMVDDYCTRERRVTNHVIVVLAEDAIRQTRCTTCDSEHPYKGGKEPRLRKKTAAPSLYEQVLSNTVGGGTERTNATDDNSVSTPALAARDAGGDDGSASTRAVAGPADSDVPGRAEDGWLAH